ncbi:MAG: hypothetical protein RR135_00360 [Oscillospiraceae bacterium]
MLRTMMLILVLMLITLSAAYLGRDEQLLGVLRTARTPVSSLVDASCVSAESVISLPNSHAHSSEISPRFVIDEPFESLPDSFLAQGSETSELLDPSARERLYPSEKSSGDFSLAPPRAATEEDAREAAEPYVRELYALSEKVSRQLDELSQQATRDYLLVEPSKRADALAQLASRYLPQINILEQQTDVEVERMVGRMKAALMAVGADDTIALDTLRAYQSTKDAQVARYLKIFSDLQSSTQSLVSQAEQ